MRGSPTGNVVVMLGPLGISDKRRVDFIVIRQRERRANAGSWLDAPTFLKLTDEAVELRAWDGSAQGKCLNSVNR